MARNPKPLRKKAKRYKRLRLSKKEMRKRTIRKDEYDLISCLLSQISEHSRKYIIPEIIQEMDDGGMGSIKLSGGKANRVLIERQYLDSDGQLVLITLYDNDQQELFELDMWKVDFSPLVKYPVSTELKAAIESK